MDKNRFEKIENIFQSAIDIPFSDRKSFLASECAGNTVLLAEVEELIRSFEKDSDFLEESMWEFGLSAIQASKDKKLEGKTVGIYRIEKKIGAGGMGDVYKAFDRRLNRFAALKFLSESMENDHTARRRLIREAQAAAALDHPNICTVHGIEEFEEQHFIVMQFVEGKTLDECLKENNFDAEDFSRTAKQIISAVGFAHSHGIIHRDLKPGNIMLTNDGQVKILDFGLAKILQDKSILMTETNSNSNFSSNGLLIGTVAYMSPEQLRGERLDFRSDIFSLGVIFYELLTKRNPFKHKSQAETIAAVLNGEITDSKEIKAVVAEEISEFIGKCLQKEPSLRFQSAAEMLIEFDKIEANGDSEKRRKNRQNFFVKAFIFVVIAVSIFISVFYLAKNQPKRTLAVLPFSVDVSTAEKEYLADGLTQGVIEKLTNLAELKVTNKYVAANFKNGAFDPQKVGKELNVDAVFTGALRKRNDILILSTKLIRTADNFVIDSKEFNVDENNINELQINISDEILIKTISAVNEAEKNKIARKDTEDNEAKLRYIRGRYFLSRRNDGNDIKEAIRLFTEATELDPAFAKAWTGLADAYMTASIPGAEKAISPEKAAEIAKFAVKKAIAIDPNLCETYYSIGNINWKFDWNWAEAKRNFKSAVNCDPEFSQAYLGLASVYRIEGNFQEAMNQTRNAKSVDPISISPDLNIASIYYYEREFEKMEQMLNELQERSPKSIRVSAIKSYRSILNGNFKEAAAILEKIYESDKISDKISVSAPLGFAYAKVGERGKALKIIENLEQFSKQNYVPSQEKAIVYVGLGEYDKAFENLKKSCDEKFSALPALMNDPLIDEIRNHTRFPELLKCSHTKPEILN